MCKPFPSSLYSSSLARKIPTTSSSGGYKSPAIFQRRKVFGSRSPVTIAAGPLGSLWKTVGRASSFLLPRVPTESARTTAQEEESDSSKRKRMQRCCVPKLGRTFQLYARNGPKQVPRRNVHIISRPDANKGAGHDFIRAAPS